MTATVLRASRSPRWMSSVMAASTRPRPAACSGRGPWLVHGALRVGTPRSMRVVTFNILNGRTPDEDRVDVDAFRAAVAALDADVLALQEVDRNQPRSQRSDLTAIAAETMGAEDHRFVAALNGSPGSTWVAATGEE